MNETGVTGTGPCLRVANVRKGFGGLAVIGDVSLEVGRGEIVSVLGVSGSGKTTLFNIIAGLEKPDSGTVEVDGKIGYMMQKDLLLPWKRLIDNAALPLTLRGMKRAEARREAGRWFGPFGLEGHEDDFPGELSGGMRQRAALLRTYLVSGDILLLDEPFAAVDAITRARLHEWLLGAYRRLGISILLITHDIDEAILLSDRIYVITDKPAAVKAEIPVRLHRGSGTARLVGPDAGAIREGILTALNG